MSTAFDVASLERGLAFLDECPTHLLQAVVTLPVGTLEERVSGIRAWREALLAGRLPPPDVWPPPDVAGPVRQALEQMGIARFCKGQLDLVDALLADMLVSFSGQAQWLGKEVAHALRELEELERRRLEEEQAARARGKKKLREIRLYEETLSRLRRDAERLVGKKPRAADEALLAGWEARVRAWAEVAAVFGDLGEMLGRGWDLCQGVLRHVGWMDVVRLGKLVEQLPQLREIVESLGRLHASDAEETVADKIFVPVRRLEEELREVITRRVPAETRGIERSGDIARMLPVEAVMLGHPKLRMLWHARRAERALLTYRVEGIEIERHLVEREFEEEVDRISPRRTRGPIIAVLDTSGSMHGVPEQVAKALVLETLRIAYAERRRCFLYAYSGPGQIIEHELDLSVEGVGRLLEFLGLTFGGGTDTSGPLLRVLERLREDDWSKADVVLASDGEWAADSRLIAAVETARESGTRFHGVQIGNRGRTGLHAVCSPVHEFTTWASLAWS